MNLLSQLPRLAFVALILVSCGTLQAQEAACTKITTVASVIDEQGIPVSGLQAAQFRATLRGKQIKLLSVTEDLGRRQVVVLLDASPSMREDSTGKWTLAKEIAAHIVQQGPARDVPKLAVFGDAPDKGAHAPAREPIARPESLADLSSGLPLTGRSERRPRLFDALADGFALLQKPQVGDVVFVVTDGGEDGSKKKPAALLHEMIGAGVRLFAVTLPMRYEAAGLSVVRTASDTEAFRQIENTDFINNVAFSAGKLLRIQPNQRSNEWGFKFTDEERVVLATSLQRLYLQAARFYRLEMELPAALKGPESWKLEIRSEEETKKSLRLTYPKYLVPCPVVSP